MTQWRPCSACKNPIPLGVNYYVCNVSTCNQKRTGMAFCSVTCWEVHLPIANHRESWAVEKEAPLTNEAPSASAPPQTKTGARRIAQTKPDKPASNSVPSEVLIVASRLNQQPFDRDHRCSHFSSFLAAAEQVWPVVGHRRHTTCLAANDFHALRNIRMHQINVVSCVIASLIE